MKHILILIADYGFGHHSAANAISEALQETYGGNCVVEIVNPLDDKRAPAFLRKEQANYNRIVREMPDLYKLGYQVSDSPAASNLIESAVTLLLFTLLRDIVRQHQPDVIVCTYPIYPAILSANIRYGETSYSSYNGRNRPWCSSQLVVLSEDGSLPGAQSSSFQYGDRGWPGS